MPKSKLFPSAKALLLVLLVAVIAVLSILPLSAVAAQSSTPPQPSYPSSAGTPPLRIMVPSAPVAQGLASQGRSYIEGIPSSSMNIARSFSPGPRPNVVGTFKTLAILVKFNDNVNDGGIAATDFDNILFNSSANSVRHFYSQNSYNQLDIVTLNLPSALGWITAPQLYSYYVFGNRCFGSYPHNCQKLAEDVATAVDLAFPSLDWSEYDNDGDGYVDTIFIIHAGQGAENTYPVNYNYIWSHSWSTSGAWQSNHFFDGKRISSYTTEPEFWDTPGDLTFGVYAHELGHALGLPDLYDIQTTQALPSQGVGNWSLMGSGSWNSVTPGPGGDSPSHFDAWSRVFLGFANSTLIAPNSTQTINLPNVENNATNAIFRINTKKPNEYFLLENRQQTGYDAGLPGDGLLIWHADDNLNTPYGPPSNQNECLQINNWLCQTHHYLLALVQADGYRDLEYGYNRGDDWDPFPGFLGITLFNFTTNPNSSSYYSSANQSISVSNISNSQSIMTAFVDTTIPDPANAAPLRNFFTVINPTLTWNLVSWAVRYEVQIDDVSTFSSPATFSTSSLSYTPTLAEGIWYWRVHACTSMVTCTGPFSPTESIRIKTS